VQASETLTSPRLAREVPATAKRQAQSMNRIAQILAICFGPAMFITWGIGGVWLARYMPPKIHPDASAQTVAMWYMHHATRIRIGLVFMMLALGFIGFWGVCIAVQLRRKEGLFPAFTYAQLVGMAGGTGIILVPCVLWCTAAYRAGHIPATTTQTLNDAGWIGMMGTWLPFTVWACAVGAAILFDPSSDPVFPRWAGYLSVISGIGFMTGSGVWFTTHGAWSWVGVLGLYEPFVIFGVWVLPLTWLCWKNLQRGYCHELELAPEG
jgi:hypothetical protein